MKSMKVEKGNTNYSGVLKSESREITKSSLLYSARESKSIALELAGMLKQSGLGEMSKISSLEQVRGLVMDLTTIVKVRFEGKDQEVALNLIYTSFAAVVASTINIDYHDFFESACGVKLNINESDELVFQTVDIQTEVLSILGARGGQKFLKEFNAASGASSFAGLFGKTHIRSVLKEFLGDIKSSFKADIRQSNQSEQRQYIKDEKPHSLQNPTESKKPVNRDVVFVEKALEHEYSPEEVKNIKFLKKYISLHDTN
jgi:hypothetical protein